MKLNPSDIPEVPARFMQEAHLEEMEMLNEVYALIDKAAAGEAVAELETKVDALLAHTAAHFADEEARMREFHFPPYPVHKQEHDRLLAEFTAAVKDWKKSGELAPLAVYLQETIPAWLMRHVSTMDYVTAHFLTMHE